MWYSTIYTQLKINIAFNTFLIDNTGASTYYLMTATKETNPDAAQVWSRLDPDPDWMHFIFALKVILFFLFY